MRGSATSWAVTSFEQGQHADGAGGPAGLAHGAAKPERAEGRLRGWLDEDGIARGDGRGELVRDEIHGEVEGRDAEDRTDGEAARESHAAFGAGRPVGGRDVAADALGFFGGDAEGLDGACDFGACVGEGLAGFADDEAGYVFGLVGELAGDGVEDRGALPGAEPAGCGEGLLGEDEGVLGIGGVGLGNFGHDGAVVGVADGDGLRADVVFGPSRIGSTAGMDGS